MNKIRPVNQQKNCLSCGAPVVSEICAYCGRATGLNTAEADMEYPVIECKEATLNFWTIVFPLIFALAFGIAGIMTIVIMVLAETPAHFILIGLPFLLVGMGASYFVVRTLRRYVKVKKHGEVIRATVYGYMDDNLLINNRPAQIVKLLIQTPGGPRFILYQLGDTIKPYGINNTIDVLMYKTFFMIDKKKDIY